MILWLNFSNLNLLNDSSRSTPWSNSSHPTLHKFIWKMTRFSLGIIPFLLMMVHLNEYAPTFWMLSTSLVSWEHHACIIYTSYWVPVDTLPSSYKYNIEIFSHANDKSVDGMVFSYEILFIWCQIGKRFGVNVKNISISFLYENTIL